MSRAWSTSSSERCPNVPHDLEPGPMVVMCGHGERAMTGASVLERAGHREVRVLDGGPDDLAAASGRTLA